MLRTIETLNSYDIFAVDGDIGRVHDFYFDDEHWTVRYLVVDVGTWLPGKKVLVSPMGIENVDWVHRAIRVTLTKQQLRNAPEASTDEPISRRYETAFNTYYGYPAYWPGPGVWAGAPYPVNLAQQVPQQPPIDEQLEAADRSHLRSADEVEGYRVQATDGEIGHIDDFVLDDQTWTIRYFVVDTRNWLPGKRVLLAPDSIDHITWGESKVHIVGSQDDVRNSPEFNRNELKARAEEPLLAFRR